MAGAVKEINGSQFENEVVKADQPVLVDFWAPWCGPCKMLGPVLEEIAEEKGDSLKVVKINVDENQDLAQKYEVMSIPTMFVFKGGEVADSFMGAMGKKDLLAKLEKHL